MTSARRGTLANRRSMGSIHAQPPGPAPRDRAQGKSSLQRVAAPSTASQHALLTRRRAWLGRSPASPAMASAASRSGAPCSASSSPPGPAEGRYAAAASGPLPAGSAALSVPVRPAGGRSSRPPIFCGAPSRSGGSLGLRERSALWARRNWQRGPRGRECRGDSGGHVRLPTPREPANRAPPDSRAAVDSRLRFRRISRPPYRSTRQFHEQPHHARAHSRPGHYHA